jgi:photosystem II stability/assembly factor-like uncharacterized protein
MNRTLRALLVGVSIVSLSQVAQSQWTQTSGPKGVYVSTVTSIGSRLFAWLSSAYPTVSVSNDGGYNWGVARWGLPAETNGIRLFENVGETLFAGTDSGLFRSTDAGSSWSNANAGLTPDSIGDSYLLRSITQLDAKIFLLSNDIVNRPYSVRIRVHESTDQGMHWQPTTRTGLPPPGRSVGALAVVDTFLFFLSLSDIHRTSINGTTWESVRGGLPDTNIYQVTTLGNLLYAVTYSRIGSSYKYRYRFHRSTDRGNSWTNVGAGLPDTLMGALHVVESDLYFISGAVYRSIDLGASWSRLTDTLMNIWATNGNRYAQTGYVERILLRSTDHGASWEPLAEPGIGTEISALAGSGTRVFASTLDDHWDYVTTDRGNSWSRMSRDRVNLNVSSFACCGPYLIAGGTSMDGGIDISSDNGSTWTRVTTRSDAQIEYLAVDSPYVFASGNGMWLSSDCGLSWKTSNDGFATYPPYLGPIAMLNARLFVAKWWDDTIYVSSDRGSSWKRAGTAGPGTLSILSLVAEGGKLFAGTYEKGIWRSTDEGTSWTQCANGLEDTTVNDIIASHGTLFAGTQLKGVYASTDAGASWKPINDGLACPHINRLLVHGQDLYAGTINEGVWRRPLSEVTGVEAEGLSAPSTFQLEQNYPNPFNPSTRIKYELPRSSDVRLTVYDLLGREVAVLANDRMEAGVHTAKFDGSALSSGMYVYRLEAGGAVLSKKLLLLK